MGFLLALLLTGLGLLLLGGFGIHAWMSGNPCRPGIAASGTGFASGLLLLLIGLGHEWNWWDLDGAAYDALAKSWAWATGVAAAGAGVAAHFASA